MYLTPNQFFLCLAIYNSFQSNGGFLKKKSFRSDSELARAVDNRLNPDKSTRDLIRVLRDESVLFYRDNALFLDEVKLISIIESSDHHANMVQFVRDRATFYLE